jgi:hypothetical protein
MESAKAPFGGVERFSARKYLGEIGVDCKIGCRN